MGKFIDIAGQRFGRLTVIERDKDYISPKGKKYARWLCQCDCGKTCVVKGNALKNGNTESCGCLQREKSSQSNQTHGKKRTRLYTIWASMKKRCLNVNNKSYFDYGGRGITICDEWKEDFQTFYDWSIAHGYRDDLSIDRIDNDKGYCPENCQWVSNKDQQNNKRNNHLVAFNGKTHTIAEWAEITGINKSTIRMRLKNGWSVERALSTANEKQMERK